jgi:hypothetical protein
LDNPYEARLALVLLSTLAALLSALTALLTTLTRLLVLLARLLLTALLLTTLLAALIRIFVTHRELLLFCGMIPHDNNDRNNLLVPRMHSGTIDRNARDQWLTSTIEIAGT